jgi:hypothetical protein
MNLIGLIPYDTELIYIITNRLLCILIVYIALHNLMPIVIQACDVISRSCNIFNGINVEMIDLVNHHYYDLQMYANFVFDIDNDPAPMSANNNFITKIVGVKTKYEAQQGLPLFLPDNMNRMASLIKIMLGKLSDDIIDRDQYLSRIVSMNIFGSGAASPTILMDVVKQEGPNEVAPLIVKFIPLQFVHHYSYLPLDFQTEDNIFKFIEAPSYALYFKEAWMYCFTKNHINKYTPTFTCVGECNIIHGFPVKSLDDLQSMYSVYQNDRMSQGKTVPYKKWFDLLVNPVTPHIERDAIMNMYYGSFEMRKIDGTLEQLIPDKQFDLSLLFEYLYAKVVCAFVGRVVFTDDHFGNVAYRKVRHVRHYRITSRNIIYNFYMSNPNMIQFIDLERYVFNYSPFDIYTNSAMKAVTDINFNPSKINSTFEEIENTYKSNNYIFDKGISSLRDPKQTTAANFIDPNEYNPMMDILNCSTFGYIEKFCASMETHLPAIYKSPPKNVPFIQRYEINLDDNTKRVISGDTVFRDALIA